MTVQRDSRIESLGNDPRSVLILKDILRGYEDELLRINELVGVVVKRVSPPTGGGAVGTSPVPLYFTGHVELIDIFLEWGVPDPPAHLYEIRRNQNDTEWDTSDFVTRTPSENVRLAPLKAGTYNFLIKSIDNLGNYSAEYDFLTLSSSCAKCACYNSYGH